MIEDLRDKPDAEIYPGILTIGNVGTKNPDRRGPDLPMSNWILAQFEDGYQGYAAEVGASDGIYVSPTWALEWKARWTVLCVEANPLIKPLLTAERSFVESCAVGSANADGVEFHMYEENLESYSALKPEFNHPSVKRSARWRTCAVNVRKLDDLLDKWQFPRLDALCIDVEGGETDVLAGTDLERWKPRVVVVECWRQGSLDSLLTDYERMWRSVDNDCYVRRHDAD